VTGIALTGHAYEPSRNAETSDAIVVGGAQPPVAVASADVTTGIAPLTVNLSATGSSDADGSIVSYTWSFSEGGTQTGATVQRLYSTPGTYTATLTVTDNAGLTGTASVTISVGSQGSLTIMSVADIAMSVRASSGWWGGTDALASVTVRDANGNPVAGAAVSGTWSGSVSGSATILTDTSGKADFRSARVRNSTANRFTFTVAGITLAGYAYDPTRNLETSDSITP
jgi:PKD repeat protein